MIQIILIKPNEFNIENVPFKSNKNDTYKNITRNDFFNIKSNYVDFEKIKNQLESFVEIINVEEEKFMNKIVELIDLDDKHYGDVRDCYEEPNNIYQVMFRLISQYDKRDTLENNILASILTYEKELIYGNVVLFKTYLPKDSYEMNNCDATFNDLVNLIMNNIYHTGVYVENNKLEQIFYNNNNEFVDPLNNFNIRTDISHIMKNDSYGYQEKDIFKYNIQLVFNKDSHDAINEPLSRIMLGPIRGSGVITSPNQAYNSFYDLGVEEVTDILKISPNFKLTEEDILETKDANNRTIVKNKYRILNSKLR